MIRSNYNLWSFPRRHPRFSALVWGLVFVGSGIGGLFLWADYHLRTAYQALERDSLDEAQHHLELCLKVRARSPAIHLLAAQVARRRDAYEEAEQHLNSCVRLAGTTRDTSEERALLTAQEGELGPLEESLSTFAAGDDPQSALALEALAKGYINRFWYVHALICLNILLDRQPGQVHALLMRARVFEKLAAAAGITDHEQEALRDYERAVKICPSFEVRLGLAGALYRLGRPWDAMLEYERLQQTEPANPQVLLGLSLCRFNLGEIDAARRLLDELLKQQPNHAAAALERGRLAFHAGELAEAEKWLWRAATFAPAHDSEPLRLLHECLAWEHKPDEARQCLERLRAKEADNLSVSRLILQTNHDPHNVARRYEIAMYLLELGREQDGIAGLFYVLEQEPRYQPAHQALADYFEKTRQPRRAALHRAAGMAHGGQINRSVVQ